MIEIRTSARLLVFDGDARLLLFLHSDGHGREFWATPGGGVRAGETLEQAAWREAAEELGVQEVELSEAWSGRSEFDYADREVLQSETFFRAKCHGEILGANVSYIHRLEGILETRWWSLDEIAHYGGVMFPVDLADRLKEYLNITSKT